MNPDRSPTRPETDPVGETCGLLHQLRMLLRECFCWNHAGKSEGREPKSEGRPKSEARRNLPSLGHKDSMALKALAGRTQLPKRQRLGFGASPVRISEFGLLSGFGLRVSGLTSFSLFTAALCSVLFAAGAAIPPPEQLLPDDTLILLTAPDFAKLRAICQKSPKSQLWNDPAMKPLKDKFESRWQEEVINPIARDLNVSLDTYASLPQGQLTFAVTKNAWQGNNSQPLGFLLLLDTRDKTDLLKTNLADLRKNWVAAGKTLKTETIRGLEFSVFPFTTNDVPNSLGKFLGRPPVFAQVTSGPDIQQEPVTPTAKP